MIGTKSLFILTIDGTDAEKVSCLLDQDLAQLREEGGYVFDWQIQGVDIHGQPVQSACPWR